MKFSYIIDNKEEVSSFLLRNGYSSKILIKLKKNGIIINGFPKRVDSILFPNDVLEVTIPEEESLIPPIDKPIEIVYEDEYFIIVYKPHGLAVMGTKAHFDDNLSSYVISYFKKNNVNSTIHLVNRLDKDTAGLVLIAKSSYIHHLLSITKITKRYYALVHGYLDDGIINEPIKRMDSSMKRMVSIDGKEAITKYRVVERKNNKSLVDIDLLTGRTHQIRVHFSHIGHPLVGDSLYGYNDGELCLESYYLGFIHPINKEEMKISLSKGKKEE